VIFESGSRLSRIEYGAFFETGLIEIEIEIPASVEILCEECSAQSTSLSSIPFERSSRLREVD
jgi:hypothetical protein